MMKNKLKRASDGAACNRWIMSYIIYGAMEGRPWRLRGVHGVSHYIYLYLHYVLERF